MNNTGISDTKMKQQNQPFTTSSISVFSMYMRGMRSLSPYISRSSFLYNYQIITARNNFSSRRTESFRRFLMKERDETKIN